MNVKVCFASASCRLRHRIDVSVGAAAKPYVLEEFGKQINASVPDRNEVNRNAFYKLVYFLVEDSINTGGALKGILFWR